MPINYEQNGKCFPMIKTCPTSFQPTPIPGFILIKHSYLSNITVISSVGNVPVRWDFDLSRQGNEEKFQTIKLKQNGPTSQAYVCGCSARTMGFTLGRPSRHSPFPQKLNSYTQWDFFSSPPPLLPPSLIEEFKTRTNWARKKWSSPLRTRLIFLMFKVFFFFFSIF